MKTAADLKLITDLYADLQELLNANAAFKQGTNFSIRLDNKFARVPISDDEAKKLAKEYFDTKIKGISAELFALGFEPYA